MCAPGFRQKSSGGLTRWLSGYADVYGLGARINLDCMALCAQYGVPNGGSASSNIRQNLAYHEGRVLRSRAVFFPAGDDDVPLFVLLDRQSQRRADEGQLYLVVCRAADSLQRTDAPAFMVTVSLFGRERSQR